MWPFKKHQAVDRRSSPDRWDYVSSAGTAIRVTATLALAAVSIAILASCVAGEGPEAQSTTVFCGGDINRSADTDGYVDAYFAAHVYVDTHINTYINTYRDTHADHYSNPRGS